MMEHGKSIRTEETGGARGVDDTTELLLAEDRPCSLGAGERALEVDFLDLVPLLVGHVLEATSIVSARTRSISVDGGAYPLSRRIPALLMRMVTVPKASTAVLITAAPSVTDPMFATAFPPPTLPVNPPHVSATELRTSLNLIHDGLRRIGIEVVYDDVRAARAKQQTIPMSQSVNTNLTLDGGTRTPCQCRRQHR